MKLSKNEKRQRKKERWFDAGTIAIEKVLPGRRSVVFPDIENPYICPLCRRGFPRTAIAEKRLTFEDAPQSSYGGNPVALTCVDCNGYYGKKVDSKLHKLDTGPTPCTIAIDGVKVRALRTYFQGEARHHFDIPPQMNHPDVATEFREIMSRKTPQEGDEKDRRRADVAWLKSAFIVAFACWGYSYIFSPGLAIVREQLARCDEEIIPRFKFNNRDNPSKTRHLMFIRQPVDFSCVAVVMGEHLVLLPDAGDMHLYSRVDVLAKKYSNFTFMGDEYIWPTAPSHSLDVLPIDSKIVRPTPGEVHLLTP